MKTVLLFILIFALLSEAATIVIQGPPQRPLGSGVSTLNTGLITYWKLEEASGTRADSEPTTPQDLTDNNTVTQTTGKIGNAAFFTAANSESLTHVDSADLSTGNIDFSVVAWAKFTSLSGSMWFVSQWIAGGNQRAWAINYDATSGRLRFSVSSDGTTQVHLQADAFGPPATNAWYMIFASHDSVNNTINISVNNGSANSVAHSTGVLDSTGAFNLGNVGSLYLDGALDECGLWKKVLSAAEVTELYNGGAGKTYPF